MFKLKLSIDSVQMKLKSTVYTAVPRKAVIHRRNSVLNNFGEELWVILPGHCELQSNNAHVPLKNSYGNNCTLALIILFVVIFNSWGLNFSYCISTLPWNLNERILK